METRLRPALGVRLRADIRAEGMVRMRAEYDPQDGPVGYWEGTVFGQRFDDPAREKERVVRPGGPRCKGALGYWCEAVVGAAGDQCGGCYAAEQEWFAYLDAENEWRLRRLDKERA